MTKIYIEMIKYAIQKTVYIYNYTFSKQKYLNTQSILKNNNHNNLIYMCFGFRI